MSKPKMTRFKRLLNRSTSPHRQLDARKEAIRMVERLYRALEEHTCNCAVNGAHRDGCMWLYVLKKVETGG